MGLFFRLLLANVIFFAASLAATAVTQLDMTSGRAERTVNWDEGFWQTRVRLLDDKHEWAFCRFRIIELSRNPNNEPPNRATSGYRVVYSSDYALEWQVWVKPYGHIFDQQRRWIDVTFEVYWIDPKASQEDRDASNCEPIPPSESPYDPGQPPPKPLPEPRHWEKTIFLRKGCISRLTQDAPGVSNTSCSDAKADATSYANAKDLCRYPLPGQDFPNDSYSGVDVWVYTPSCGPSSP
jgi:hypothetical protein